MLFTSGLQHFVTEVVVGIIAILILALLMDGVLVLLERLLTPWTRAWRPPEPQNPALRTRFSGDEALGRRTRHVASRRPRQGGA